MKLYQIAVRSLSRKKGKMMFMLLGLVLGVATVVSIYSIVRAMQSDIQRQLAELGANLIITAGKRELTFQYGGITIPELVYDMAKLSEADYDAVRTIPGARAILALSPKLIGTVTHKDHTLVISGTDLPAELAVKPWLRFYEKPEEEMPRGSMEKDGEKAVMNYRPLNLDRVKDVPALAEDQVVLGYKVAAMLELEEGGTLELDGKAYSILAILEEGGTAEDNQVLMSLEEARSLLGRPGELTVIEIASDFNLVSEEALLRQLRQALPHASVTGVRQAVMGRNELMGGLSRFGMFAMVAVFLTGTLVVLLTMSASVRERTREIGIFRAIGFQGKQIFSIIATEGIMVSVAGGLIGYHAGLWAARLAGPVLSGIYVGAPWELSLLLLTVTATAGTGGLACLYPALSAARLDPAEALRFY